MGFEDAEGGPKNLRNESEQGAISDRAEPGSDGLMTFEELVGVLKDGRLILVVSTLICLGVGVILLLMAPTKYEAYVKIAPVEERSNMGSGSEGLLSTIGIQLGDQEFTSFDHFIETLTSVKLADRLEKDEELSKRIFSYDKEAKEFNRPKSPVALLSQFLNWVFGQPGWMPPQNYDLAHYFEISYQFEQDRDTGVVKITYRNKNRAFAEELLSTSLRMADEILREEERALNIARHAYLEERLQTEIRQTNRTLVAELLLDAEQRLMLVNVDPAFGARIVDGPTSSSRPASPRVMLTLFISVVAGFMIGIGILVVRILIGKEMRRA